MSQATEQQTDGSIAGIGRAVADDAMKLVRAEIALAREQMKEAAIKLVFALAFLVVAAVLLLIGTVEALGALPARFSVPLFGNTWLGWAALGGVFIIVALLFALLGTAAARRSFKDGKQTMHTFKEDAEWAKGLTKRSGSGS